MHVKVYILILVVFGYYLLNCSSSHRYGAKITAFDVCKKVHFLNMTKINRKTFRLK